MYAPIVSLHEVFLYDTLLKLTLYHVQWVFLVITVRPHEPRPPGQNFETNFEISQSQVEI